MTIDVQADQPRLRRLAPFRFLAAVMVVFFHFGSPVFTPQAPWLEALMRHGSIAVSFFFCLSGFIMGSVYRTAMTASQRADYWLSRFARIYPVYLLGLVSVLAIRPATGTETALSVLLLQSWVPGYALAANSPGWSLSVEALFYALFPFMAGTLSRQNQARWIAAAAALWIGTQWLTSYVGKYHLGSDTSALYFLIYYFPPVHLNEFVIGVVAASAVPLAGKSAATVARVCTGAVFSVAILQWALLRLGMPVSASNGLYAPVFAAFFWLIVALPRVPLLERRWPVMLGEASYAIYVLQVPVMVGLARYTDDAVTTAGAANFWLGLVLLIAIALCCHSFFEQPLRKWLKANWQPVAAA